MVAQRFMIESERTPFETSAESVKKSLRAGSCSVYDLAATLGWTYGRTNFVTTRMLNEGMIYSKETMNRGRALKIVSLVPFEPEKATEPTDIKSNEIISELSGVCSKQNEVISAIITRKIVDKKVLLALVKELGIDLGEMAEKLEIFLPKEG